MVKKTGMDTKQIGSLCLLVLVVVGYLVYSSYFKKIENFLYKANPAFAKKLASLAELASKQSKKKLAKRERQKTPKNEPVPGLPHGEFLVDVIHLTVP